jgi:hypothetical protein
VGELVAHYWPTQGHLSSTLKVCVRLTVYCALTFAYHQTVMFLFLSVFEGWLLVICVFLNFVNFRR